MSHPHWGPALPKSKWMRSSRGKRRGLRSWRGRWRRGRRGWGSWRRRTGWKGRRGKISWRGRCGGWWWIHLLAHLHVHVLVNLLAHYLVYLFVHPHHHFHNYLYLKIVAVKVSEAASLKRNLSPDKWISCFNFVHLHSFLFAISALFPPEKWKPPRNGIWLPVTPASRFQHIDFKSMRRYFTTEFTTSCW